MRPRQVVEDDLMYQAVLVRILESFHALQEGPYSQCGIKNKDDGLTTENLTHAKKSTARLHQVPKNRVFDIAVCTDPTGMQT